MCTRRKAAYIRSAVETGLKVLADKPMSITPAGFWVLEDAFRIADENGVVPDDVMTERFEITSILQRRLSQLPALFGEMVPGSPEEPAVAKESVRHFSKVVSGRQSIRPAWLAGAVGEGSVLRVYSNGAILLQGQGDPREAHGPPAREIQSILTRCFTTTRAYELARPEKPLRAPPGPASLGRRAGEEQRRRYS